jgi:hypothetical protein
MDSKSHELFAQVLLNVVDEHSVSPKIWGNAPDVDMNFLHRWYRHRISVLPDIYKENLKDCKPETLDKDAIVLCVISHLYLDLFNGIVFPFGAWHPIYPENTVLNDVLNNVDEPKLLIADLKKLSGGIIFSDMFYAESKGIMQEFVRNMETVYIPSMTELIVRRLAMHAKDDYRGIYNKATHDIAKFTENDIYDNIYDVAQPIYACKQFEINYADLINKVMSC